MTVQNLSEINAAAGQYWDARLTIKTPGRVRWWEDETTRRHINHLLIGEPLDGLHFGFHERIARLLGSPVRRAISVGCGIGAKEWNLIQRGLIEHFDLYDVSEANIEHGKKHADQIDLGDKVTYHLADVFQAPISENYDLVYWNNALHHMPDVFDAMVWTKERLRPGGLFAMDDFVGPTRFQGTDENLRWANLVRANLSERYLQNPWEPGTLVSREVCRPTPEYVIALDPSEAADSERIVDAIERVFPHAEITPTGGALYHLALNDIFCNFTTQDDLALLRQILLLDKLLAENGTTQYAVAFARAPDNSAGRSN
jgi:SAM-dependent methyltransferase